MKKRTPFLTGFSKHLYGSAKRKTQAAIALMRNRALRNSISGYGLLFDSVLGADFLQSIDPTIRQRCFGHIPVFWAWVGQILECNASCSKALAMIQSWNCAANLSIPSSNTSGYCQARGRLSWDFLRGIHGRVGGVLNRRISPENRWHGRVVKAIDGSSAQLLDTVENQEVYPQPGSQKPGCGFPVMSINAVLNISNCSWEGFATDDLKGSDSNAAARLLEHFGPGDVVLADRAYCTYELIARLQERRSDVVMRLHQARHRKLDWRKGKRIAPDQRLVTWHKPSQQPRGSELDPRLWDALPATITLRYIRFNYRDRSGVTKPMIVVSTLLDATEFDSGEITALYARRWDIELRLRDIKTTMGMELLAVQTPELAHKTLYMMMIAYNLLRTLMQEAADNLGVPSGHLSLKSTLDLVNSIQGSFQPLGKHPRKRQQKFDEVIDIIATKVIDIRPGRSEPRAVKRRPKPYQLLTKRRGEFQEIYHKENYRRAA